MHQDVERILVDENELAEITTRLANDIMKDYANSKKPLTSFAKKAMTSLQQNTSTDSSRQTLAVVLTCVKKLCTVTIC